MKTKPILIVAAIAVVLVAGILFFTHSKKTGYKAKTAEVADFLQRFNNQVKQGNADSLIAYFDHSKRLTAFKKLVSILIGKDNPDASANPPFSLSLDVDNGELKFVTASLIEAAIPTMFAHDSVSNYKSTLVLKIRKTGPHSYKIVQVDARRFLADYASYETIVKNRTGAAKDEFSAITLAAFKTAEGLKSRYDTVAWFAHLDNKTWFYVAKGQWKCPERGPYVSADSADRPNNLGLLNPELKEIIPPQYDLIHNINGTWAGMVEVEKGGKKGFYNLAGKLVVPVNYDQIFPIDDESNMAVLRSGSDYFYLKKDTTISEKVSLKIVDFFSKIRGINGPLSFRKNALAVITEYNSKDEPGAIFIPPSYLADLNLVPKIEDYENPLRRAEDEGFTKGYEVSNDEKVSQNWFEATFYSIRDYFLGGRSEFYDNRNLIIVDKRNDQILTSNIQVDYEPDGDEALEGLCDVNSIKQINDTLFEVKSGARLFEPLYDSTKYISGGTYYHYLALRGNKLIELKDHRLFGFTKYVKMDDSYLNGCYTVLEGSGRNERGNEKTVNRITPEMLRLMKNEIFADYRYKFKDPRWESVFEMMDSYNIYTDGDNPQPVPFNTNVDDSLTAVDKYNINWIAQKLSGSKQKTNSLAAR